MNLGRVIGSLWATQKYPTLVGKRMVIVQPLAFSGEDVGNPLIALDTVDAGPGETVIYASSSEAAIPFAPDLVPTDATVVGIVEQVDHVDGSRRTTAD